MDLKVSVKNFGPIKEGEVELSDLNVFIGSNNAGKSYFATLIYSLLQSLSAFSGSRSERRLRYARYLHQSIYYKNRDEPYQYRLTENEIKAVLKKMETLNTNSEQDEVPLEEEIFFDFRKRVVEGFRSGFVTNLKKYFTPDIRKLVLFKENTFEINIANGEDIVEFVNKKNDLIINKNKLTWKNVKLAKTGSLTNLQKKNFLRGENVVVNGNTVSILFTKAQISRLASFTKEGSTRETIYAIEEMQFLIGDALWQTLPDIFFVPRVYYLPAARSGILQAQRILAANVFQMIPLFGIKSMEIGQMSGTVADFLTNILNINPEDLPITDPYESFERKLIHGIVDLRGRDQFSLPQIIYETKKHQILLNRASSTVSELAPLFIFLKYIIRKGDMVIIEEPEAHLHPANQKLLAELINALVVNQVQVLMTTHSDFLLGQLSLFIKTPSETHGFIRATRTKVNLFKYNEETRGTTVTEVSVSDQEGVDEEEFGTIYEELYNEHLKIDLDRETSEEGI